ncbi:precorrin-3B C(17)-methyltransferase [Victivallaceae bacterium BBE-744-WT-12]|mgnify:FL=1|uniref:Precorrin-3B C(17)-methyltransferase n=1 Tax=Victivallis lenta TaxID=2606640 RepID=A0A844G431_9BACT|nr:precorrin-3B C(17)-methyltransferase [Victivallis lenta]AVM45876.1 precorrin-3B C(17)-methyltransferase [Victivallales bacterium CCUG 44730]MBS1454197.1 precorrin-3B C(17)-methyltransferase [Lentisphaeria bacterium]MBS5531694.1 precorrin-3B C(17)-methyltransferase [bacterium]MST97682.1 precorrin-3B C(17)-methyltransferase [Victivallis lenta]HBP08649.1 precorrin-3B C(17)-methyltransferase [Lentisphaeria bacterium]
MSKVFAVGIGPGSPELLTFQARRVLEQCTAVAGYRLYLDQIRELLDGKRLIPGAMRQEIARCREALEAALAGETVAVVSSGDAGVYGMAGLLLELTELERYRSVEIEVVPGITAALAAAALIGAPFMNDFAVLSLSDLMTPKELIQKRLYAVASCDMPAALYNPRSTRRHELLEEAVSVFRDAGGDLPCALIHDACRDKQRIELTTLGTFPFEHVWMTTIVIIGNSATIVRDGRFYCRRGYREKHEFEA